MVRAGVDKRWHISSAKSHDATMGLMPKPGGWAGSRRDAVSECPSLPCLPDRSGQTLVYLAESLQYCIHIFQDSDIEVASQLLLFRN